MHAVKMALLVALVGFGLTTGAMAQTSADSRAADRRAAANALGAFSDALRGQTHDYKQARMLAGAEFLRQAPGFTTGNRFLTSAYYTALYGRDTDIRSARDWLNSFLIVGTYRFRITNPADTAKIWAAIYHLMDFERDNHQPSKLHEALNSVRDSAAFGSGNVKLGEGINRIGNALEKRNRGYWWMPFTARFDARRAQNSLRDALRGY